MRLIFLGIGIIYTSLLSAAELYKCPRPPLIDGVKDEIWNEAGEYQLVDIKTKEPLRMDTVARIMYDDQCLYFFVDCQEGNLVEARSQEKFTRHDAPVWNNCCVEFFIDTIGNGRTYHQFVVDLHGSAAELLHNSDDRPSNEIDWNGFWRRSAGESADGWTIECAIPWRTLGVAPGVLPRLGLNISRARRISPTERGTLAIGSESISRLDSFPVFEDLAIQRLPLIGEIVPSAVFLGQNRVKLRLQSQADTAMAGKIEIAGVNEAGVDVFRETRPLELAAGESIVEGFDYRIDNPGRMQITANWELDGQMTFIDTTDYAVRQTIELNDRRPHVFEGHDHPVLVRIFTDESGWALDVSIYDDQGVLRGEKKRVLSDKDGFLVLPTASLEPGDYLAKFKLSNEEILGETEVPITVVRGL